MTTPHKGRFVVFSQLPFISYCRLGYIRLRECHAGLGLPAEVRERENRRKSTGVVTKGTVTK